MINSAAVKLNIPSFATITRLYIEWTGKRDGQTGEAINPAFSSDTEKKLLPSQLAMLSEINTGFFGYPKPKKMTYKYFRRKLGLSKETIGKNLKDLIRRNIIEVCSRSRYRLKTEIFKTNYIIIDDFLYIKDWKIKEKIRRLTFNQIFVLEYIISMHKYCEEKLNKYFIASQNKIAKGLNLAPTTVCDSLKVLMDAGLITRHKATPKDGYGDSLSETEFSVDSGIEGEGDGYSLSAYIPNKQLLKIEHPNSQTSKKEIDVQTKPESQDKNIKFDFKTITKPRHRDLINMADLYFEKLHNAAIDAALAAEKKAKNDEIYNNLKAAQLNNSLKQASLLKSEQTSEELIIEQAKIELDIKNRLKELNIGQYSSPKFRPIYKCNNCEDTGKTLDTGQPCKCYRDFLIKHGYKSPKS